MENIIHITIFVTAIGSLITAIGVVASIICSYKNFKNVNRRLNDLPNSYNKLKDAILKLFEGLPPKLNLLSTKDINDFHRNSSFDFGAASESPLALTEIGKQIAIEIKAEEILERCKIDKSDFNDLNNPFDIQEKLINLFNSKNYQSIMEKQDIEVCKIRAYKEGQRIEEITVVLVVLLRDKMFKEKGLKY